MHNEYTGRNNNQPLNLKPGGFMKKKHVVKAVREGRLEIGGWSLICHHLDNKTRAITQQSFCVMLGIRYSSTTAGMKLAEQIDSPILQSANVKAVFNRIVRPITYTHNDKIVNGYEASTIIEYCKAILEARQLGYLKDKQSKSYAKYCESLIIGCAIVGINALIDEVTGFTKEKKKDEYQRLFQAYIQDQFRQWEKEFPDEFFEAIYKLYGLPPNKSQHPQFFGNFINRYIYYPLAGSEGVILDSLNKVNPPIDSRGGRRYKQHQFLSDELGLKALRKQINDITLLAQISISKQEFERLFKRKYKAQNDQLELDLFYD